MSAVSSRPGPALVRLELDPDGSEGRAHARVVAVDGDGADREVAAWPVRAPYGDVVLARSADGARVGVLVGEELRTIATGSGETVDRATGPAIAAPVPGVPTADAAAFAAAVRRAGEAVLVWVDGLARVVWPEADGPLRAPLNDGWSIELLGEGIVDPDQATGDGATMGLGSGTPFLFGIDESITAEEYAEAVRAYEATAGERRAEAKKDRRTPRPFRLVAGRAGRETVVHEELSAPQAGCSRLHWPPVVTPHGLLLRRSVAVAEESQASREMQHPWLVTPEGEVRTLPFQLGVGPRDSLPDGRLLVPGYDPLWWDGSDEAPTALTLEGDVEPLRVGPEGYDDRARPHRLLRDAFPDLSAPWPPPSDDEGWHVVDARVDGEAGEVVALLVEGFPEPHPAPEEDPTAWAVVAFGLGGDGPARGIAHGAREAGVGTSFAL